MDKGPKRLSGECGVPSLKSDRERIKEIVKSFFTDIDLTPPVPFEALAKTAEKIIKAHGLENGIRDFIIILLNNLIWQDYIAAVPFNRRILLIPQCLRNIKRCRAEMDELGLICLGCGACSINTIRIEAEKLGYIVLIAEGTSAVIKLIETGKLDAVVGVSCLPVLERSFPYLCNGAVPGMAIPLHKEGCRSTEVDLEWLHATLRLEGHGITTGRVDLNRIKKGVYDLFPESVLKKYLSLNDTGTEKIALEWMSREGKRWRPFLTAAVFEALTGTPAPFTEGFNKILLAIECFHKASLIHDDIEDNDDLRYGRPALHKQFGLPVALNTGDFLLGEGYRLIADSGFEAPVLAEVFRIASHGHRKLALGQGEELLHTHGAGEFMKKKALTVKDVLEIFRLKTAPAFEVALKTGAVLAGADDRIHRLLKDYSRDLGIAYQIKDDMEDYRNSDSLAPRVSLLKVIAAQSTETQPVIEAGMKLFDKYKHNILAALEEIKNIELKIVLRRVTGRILNDI